MHILLIGASGMVGQGALLACIADSRVTRVTALVRKPLGIGGGKVRELICSDLFEVANLREELIAPAPPDACLFCAGVSSFGMSESEYRRTTYYLTLTVARFLVTINPQMRFVYVSGAGTDSTERGRTMWARVKGATENELLRVGFAGVALFRPGYIHPLDGIRSRTALYNVLYSSLYPVFLLLHRFAPNVTTDTRSLGRAMVAAVQPGAPTGVIDVKEINRLGRP